MTDKVEDPTTITELDDEHGTRFAVWCNLCDRQLGGAYDTLYSAQAMGDAHWLAHRNDELGW